MSNISARNPHNTDLLLTEALIPYFDQLTRMHDHICPRQVLGVRIGLLAAKLLQLELPQSNKRLLTFVETDGCFADGISVSTGCWLGHRTMRVMDFGKVAATFVDTRTDRAVRIWPNPLTRMLAKVYAPDVRDRWHTQLQAYQIMPDHELLMAMEVAPTMSIEALVSKAGIRVTCDECGEEILNEREVHRDGQTLCIGCAGENYFQEERLIHLNTEP